MTLQKLLFHIFQVTALSFSDITLIVTPSASKMIGGVTYIYTNYTNLPLNAIVRLPHPRSGDSQGQEMVLASSAEKQTRNYDTQC